MTPDLKKEVDFLRLMEYPALTDAEIFKVAVGAQAVIEYLEQHPAVVNQARLQRMRARRRPDWSQLMADAHYHAVQADMAS